LFAGLGAEIIGCAATGTGGGEVGGLPIGGAETGGLTTGRTPGIDMDAETASDVTSGAVGFLTGCINVVPFFFCRLG